MAVICSNHELAKLASGSDYYTVCSYPVGFNLADIEHK